MSFVEMAEMPSNFLGLCGAVFPFLFCWNNLYPYTSISMPQIQNYNINLFKYSYTGFL